jgi:hypothetical protein
MPSLAATSALVAATNSDSLASLITVAVLALVLLAAGYLTWCWLFPFTSCHHAAGRAWRCRRCQGTSKRLRAGRRLINHVRATRRR